MINLFRYIGFRNLQSHPARTLLTVLGVACGVALYVAITVINESTLAYFKESVNAVAGKATLTVMGGETGFDEKIADRIESAEGVTHVAPVVETRAWLTSTNETLVILGVDLLQEKAVRSYQAEGKKIIGDSLSFITEPNAIILTDTFARAHALREGDALELTTVHGKAKFMVRGILSPTGLANAYGGGMAIMDIDGARHMFGKEGKTDRIDLVTAENADINAIAERVRALVGPGLVVERPEIQSEQMERMTHSFQIILKFFSTLSLIVGVFLIGNAVSISVAERRKETGILRALGATKRGILLLFMSEALGMGVFGSFLGAFLGRGLASVMVKSVTRSMTSQYLQRVDVKEIQFGARHVAWALAAGAISAVIASLWPSFRATRIQAVEAMRNHEEVAEDDGKPDRGFLARRGWIGTGLMLFSVVVSLNLNTLDSRFWEIAMQLAAVIGSALAGPALVAKMVRALRPIVRAGNWCVLRLAQDNLLRNPKRTGSNVMTLMVGLILVVLIASVTTSFKGTLIAWYQRILHADLVISSNGRMASYQSQPLHESIRPKIEHVPGVAAVYGMRFTRGQYQDKQIVLKAYDEPPKDLDGYSIFDVQEGPREAAVASLYSGKELAVIVSRNFVMHFKMGLGDWLELNTPAGTKRLHVVAVNGDLSSPVGTLSFGRPLYRSLYNDPLMSAFGVKVGAGLDPVTVRADLDRILSREYKLTITSNAQIRGYIKQAIDDSFSYARTIEVAALLVALFGLLNTLLISVMERTRELGMLRALGMSRGQVSRMILIEAATQGGFGAIVAVILGLGLSVIWIRQNLAHALGWVVEFYIPWASLGYALLMGFGVALLAAWIPARKASHLEIVEALDYE